MDADPGHTPVLLSEVCDALAPAFADRDPDTSVLIDATVGLAGHSATLLERFEPRLAVVFDRDAEALRRARVRLTAFSNRVRFVHAPFSDLRPALDELGVADATAILADLGVSSLQLDLPERGFSFRADAPLDMRMDVRSGRPAAELIAECDVGTLTGWLRDYAEEPDAHRIAAAVVHHRPTTTLQLADVVTAAMSSVQRRKLGRRIHPATRTFQALRIAVNDELGQLERLLTDAPAALAEGGRLAIISFHSLEDQRIKRRFRELSRPPHVPAGVPLSADRVPRASFRIPRGLVRGVTPDPAECDENPRARSARLRVLERCTP